MSDVTTVPNATQAKPKVTHKLVSLCFLSLILLGFVYGIYQIFSQQLIAKGIAPWLNGTAEKQLDDKLMLPGYEQFQTWDAAWRYRLLGQLGPQVQQGCPGWLFYTDGLRSPIVDPLQALKQRVLLMQSLAARLRTAGLELLVVAVPDKSRILYEKLCGLHRPPSTQAILHQWGQAVTAQHIPYVALVDVLATNPTGNYYRTDVHMTQTGAAQAARAVATLARPLVDGQGDTSYQITKATHPEQRVGDLLTLAGLADAPNGWRPPPDQYTPETFSLADTGGGLLAEDSPIKVLLAGSSNSRRSNFAEQLSRDLGQPIWNLSRDGGKFADALSNALENQADWPKSLKLIIWEMSEMSLYAPLTEGEKKIS
ncbi:alginate O-acetyltransferase AlgX-related protein [Castellaniella sp.]|uniref:alginate O-acetyltransferase AlgX-related protein n=1 Tax=Castellaniella sp. TaxID=1955812 RepID=UPI002AFEFE65|nr:cell division protein FtsQ [Castellaniella sp.]